MFLAVDLAGQVHWIALGEEQPGVESPGWPIRMVLSRSHVWLASGDRCDIREIGTAVVQWGLHLADCRLVILSAAGREQACQITEALGCRAICIPHHRYMISPRGVVPAGILREYSRRFDPVPLDWSVLQSTFVDLMEQAAEDVQAARFEQDDSVLDRYAEVRWPGSDGSVLCPVESISDPQWFFETLGHSAVDLLSLHLRCAVELPDSFPARIAPSDGHIVRALATAASQETGPAYDRTKLLAGDGGLGPTTILEPDLSIRIGERWAWRISDMGHLICESR